MGAWRQGSPDKQSQQITLIHRQFGLNQLTETKTIAEQDIAMAVAAVESPPYSHLTLNHAINPNATLSMIAKGIARVLTRLAVENSGRDKAMPRTLATAAWAPAFPPAPTNIVRNDITIMWSAKSS